ncbi:hypothetical protein [Crateriforma conspicua]|uniref:Uncharacterized protein n=1 Tax=Crateriforma conspicua TaxID=2527996 RepID=A0A5C6FU65_9PLAN|nr:hypothetical protein [Crateriforma conspicua]TWU66439.1 hypothetical protein V7x_20050 [Crateriforma conspicua]
MAKKRSKATSKPDAERTRRESALRGMLADHLGEKLTQKQRRDIAWWQKRTRAEIADEILCAVPKGQFCKLAGRQQKVIDEQAERYDLPIDGPAINLREAIRAYHDLITANAKNIHPADDAEAIAKGEVSPHSKAELEILKLKEEVRKLQSGNERAELLLIRDRGDTIDRRQLRDMLSWLTTRLQGMGRQVLQCDNIVDAHDCINDMLEDMAQEAEHGVLVI